MAYYLRSLSFVMHNEDDKYVTALIKFSKYLSN